MAQPSAEDKGKYESPYQPMFIDVAGKKWDLFGNGLIGFSTIIMILQGAAIGPLWVWTLADNVTTVCFTFELLVRMFEKGYLFYVEEGKYWNFFDTLVVCISLGSMLLLGKKSHQDDSGNNNGHHHKHDDSGGGGAASKLKVLRVLRLLRLLRLLRVLKGIEKVTVFVDYFLKSVAWSFIGTLVVAAMAALVLTMIVAVSAGAKAWLMVHKLPPMPKIE